MAIKNKADIQTAITTNIPDPNGTDFIDPSEHRIPLEDLVDSSINRLDDDAGNIIYDKTVTPTPLTIFQEVELLKTQIGTANTVLRKGTIVTGNTFGLPVGTQLAVAGDFANAVIAATGADVLITVNFTTPIGNTDYIVTPPSIVSNGVFFADNSQFQVVTKNEASSSFQIGIKAFGAPVRDLLLKIVVNEFVI